MAFQNHAEAKHMQTPAQIIKHLRNKLQLTQAELAFLYNMTPPFDITTSRVDITKYENEYQKPPAMKLLKFQKLSKEY